MTAGGEPITNQDWHVASGDSSIRIPMPREENRITKGILAIDNERVVKVVQWVECYIWPECNDGDQ